MKKLTAPQRSALRFAVEHTVELFQNGDARWSWFGVMGNGMTIRVAGNPTIHTLTQRGFLKSNGSDTDRRVSITPSGRAALENVSGSA